MKIAKIQIQIFDKGWILEKCASEIASRSCEVNFNTSTDHNADLQYYINYSCWTQNLAPVELAFLTYSERDPKAKWKYFEVAKAVDHNVCMSKIYAKELREQNSDKVSLITPGVD